MYPNVKYELQELELLMHSDQKPADDSAGFKQTIGNEVVRIKQVLMHEIFTFEDERHLERYIQYHQQSLIRLLDKTSIFLNSKVLEDAGLYYHYNILYSGLEELLIFVERHFTKYFDQDAKAPEGYISIARNDARSAAEKLQGLLSKKEADPRIIQLMLHVLNKIAKCDLDKGVSYRKVMYAKEIQKELFRLLSEQNPIPDFNEELRQIMYYLNYNSSKVLTYHAHHITTLLDDTQTRGEKMEKLSLALKKINQAQVKPGIMYNQFGCSLKDQLNSYISEEIEHQERLQQLSGSSSHKSGDTNFNGFKLKFNASVAQLAFILKILTETKIIVNSNLTQILQFLVQFVETKRSETISFGSFRSKYYNIETGTRDSVRNMMTTIIQYIDKTY